VIVIRDAATSVGLIALAAGVAAWAFMVISMIGIHSEARIPWFHQIRSFGFWMFDDSKLTERGIRYRRRAGVAAIALLLCLAVSAIGLGFGSVVENPVPPPSLTTHPS
jgi:hypothetical protein